MATDLVASCEGARPPRVGEDGRLLGTVPLTAGALLVTPRLVRAPDGDEPGHQRQHEEHADTGQGGSEAPVGLALLGDPGPCPGDLGLRQARGRVEEGSLGVVEVRGGPVPPLQGAAEPGPPGRARCPGGPSPPRRPRRRLDVG